MLWQAKAGKQGKPGKPGKPASLRQGKRQTGKRRWLKKKEIHSSSIIYYYNDSNKFSL